MRITIECFSKPEKTQSWYRMRLIKKGDVAKSGWRDIYWTLPFLVRLLARIDEVADSDPEYALELADHSRQVAQRIRVGKAEHEYAVGAEREDFVMLTQSYYSTALCLNGEEGEAREWAGQAIRSVSRSDADPFAVAEVYRRGSFILVETGKFTAATELAQKAATIFKELKEYDRLALCHLHAAQGCYFEDGPGEALPYFCQALYWGAVSGNDRGRRAVSAAAVCLARSTLTLQPFPFDAVKWIAAARKAMVGQPRGLLKLQVHWVEALAAYRGGKGRYAITRLRSISRQLAKLNAFGDMAACVADLITIVVSYEPERLDEIVEESSELLRRATPDSARSLVETWIAKPKDVALLRRLGTDQESSSSLRG